MTDRLDAIDTHHDCTCEVCWLVAEVRRLRVQKESDDYLIESLKGDLAAARAEAARLRAMLTVEALIEAFDVTASGEYIRPSIDIDGTYLVTMDGTWDFRAVLAALEGEV